MNQKNSYATTNFTLVLTDLFMLIIVYFVSVHFNGIFNINDSNHEYLSMVVIFIIIFLLMMMIIRMYDITTFNYPSRVVRRIIGASIFAMCTTSFLIYILGFEKHCYIFLAILFIIEIIIMILYRMIVGKQKKLCNGRVKTVLFIGNKTVSEKYNHYIDMTTMWYNFKGIFEYTDEQINTPQNFEEFIIKNAIQEVIVIYNENIEFKYKEYIQICEEMGINVQLVFDINITEMDNTQNFVYNVGHYPVIVYHNIPMKNFQLFLKRTFDFIASLVGIILLSPLMCAVAIAIKIDSPGPVFFKQKRVGYNGTKFDIVKFRSMCCDAEEQQSDLEAQNISKGGMVFKVKNDPRITRVGKFLRRYSIDELPQLFNVIRGDMSLVGTRPPTVSEVEKYQRKHRRRISIIPGITGMWQVNGRSDITDFEAIVALDTQYIDQWSFVLDIKLLLKTVKIILQKKGAY